MRAEAPARSSNPSLSEAEVQPSPGRWQDISSKTSISVIIPALNESEVIHSALASTQNSVAVECIVVDGGSADGTADVARSWKARVVSSLPGRARQMNAGAESANGQLLVFLHADSQLPQGFDQHIRTLTSQPGVVAGAFQLCIDGSAPGLRIVEKAANWRSRYLQTPYGDQAIFLKTALFRKMGGFPDLPIMEDFELVRRLRRKGRIVIAPAPTVTSARRWQELGVLRTTLINQFTILAFYAGIDPCRLARWYHQNGV
jgi:rSAM/selenodomain-associated transferase 2